MTETELIEKMARAMWNLRPAFKASVITHASRWEWEDFPCDDIDPRRYLLENAHAALAAIREALQEPTDAMIDAGDAALFNAGDEDLPASYIGPVWKAMLSASPLKGEE